MGRQGLLLHKQGWLSAPSEDGVSLPSVCPGQRSLNEHVHWWTEPRDRWWHRPGLISALRRAEACLEPCVIHCHGFGRKELPSAHPTQNRCHVISQVTPARWVWGPGGSGGQVGLGTRWGWGPGGAGDQVGLGAEGWPALPVATTPGQKTWCRALLTTSAFRDPVSRSRGLSCHPSGSLGCHPTLLGS